MSTSDLLEQSRQAHRSYRDHVPHRVANGTGGTVVIEGDPVVAGASMTTACRLLVEAYTLDPQHTDPAWKPEDDALLTFYSEQLSR